jgi:hypothetical protein
VLIARRDRINYSRAILRRFIRDCVVRDAAVYSPWLLKPAVAARYNVPTDMPEAIRRNHERYKVAQMEKRKRDRDERLGIAHAEEEGEEEEAAVEVAADAGAPAKKRKKKEEKSKVEEEERMRVEDARRRGRFTKYGLDGEWSSNVNGLRLKLMPNRPVCRVQARQGRRGGADRAQACTKDGSAVWQAVRIVHHVLELSQHDGVRAGVMLPLSVADTQ